MPGTSPYQGNDYQALSQYRGYKLPIDAIFKGITAQNQFWDEGAARVKNVYENVLNLPLTIQGNKDIRDNFIKEADKEITKLSTMDLSNPDIQRKGLAIYSPLYKDQGIISDNAATKHIQEVNSKALSYKDQDGGKYYNRDNHEYALLGSRDFQNSQDRMAGLKYLKSAKEYEPYYDYTSDFEKALKNCPEDSGETQDPYYLKDKDGNQSSSGYFKYHKESVRSVTKTQGCLMSGMSPKGLRQLQIEGVVRYNGHTDTLASDTIDYLTGSNSNYADQLEKLAAAKHNLNDNKNLSADEKKIGIQGLQEQIDNITSSITSQSGIVSKLQSGDLSPILGNEESYAQSVYTYRKLLSKAMSNSVINKSDKTIVDPLQMGIYLKGLEHDYDVSLENIKAGIKDQERIKDAFNNVKGNASGGEDAAGLFTKDADGNTILNPNISYQTTPIFTPGTDKPDPLAFQHINDEFKRFGEQNRLNNTALFNSIIRRARNNPQFRDDLLAGFNLPKGEDGLNQLAKTTVFKSNKTGQPLEGIHETTWFNAWFSAHKDDEELNKWSATYNNAQLGISTLKRRIELGDNRVFSELGIKNLKNEVERNISNLPNVNIDNQTITPNDINNAILGNKIKGLEYKTIHFGMGDIENALFYKGHQITGNNLGRGFDENWSDELHYLSNMADNVANTNEKINNKINTKRAEVFSKLGLNRDRWVNYNDSKGNFIQGLQRHFPKKNEDPNSNISIMALDMAGGIKLNFPGAKAGDNDLIDKFRKIGYKANVETDGVVEVHGTPYGILPQAINDPILKDVALQVGTVTETLDYKKVAPGEAVKAAEIQFPIFQNGTRITAKVETIKQWDGNPEYKITLTGGNNISKEYSNIGNAYSLIEQLSNLKKELEKK